MARLKTYIYFCLIFSGALCMHSQHYQFSQFYAAPTYLNPAFTGANVCSRVSVNYRSQWVGIPGAFTSRQVALDHSLKKYHSGIGIQFFNDKAGPGSLSTTQVSFLYAYEAKLNKKTMGRGGISLGSIQRKVDYDALTFGDQIARGGNQSSVEGFADNRTNYFDVSAGFLVYTAATWFGLAANHINKPNQSLMNNVSPLPPEFKFHGGYRFTIEEHESSNRKIPYVNSITFTFNYKKQSKFNQIDAGIYYTKNMFVLGGWYRGIPLFKPEPGYTNNDALVFLFGINVARWKVGYSYDYTISRLSNMITKGANEISMAYQLCNPKKGSKKKKNVLISCPKF